MLDRRTFISQSGVATAALPVAASAAARPRKAAPLAVLPERSGIDRDRAAFIMGQAGLDALVLEQPDNVYYTTGIRPAMARFGIVGTTFAIVPRDKTAPIHFVSPQFPYYYTTADVGLAPGVIPLLVTGEIDGVVAPHAIFASVVGEPFTPRERNRRERTSAAAPYFASAQSAIGSVLASLGVKERALGYDSIHAMRMLAAAAPNASGRDGLTAIKHIRLVKSPYEVAMMRAASEANVAAALATARQFRKLGTTSAIRTQFNAEAAKRGNVSGFLVINGVVDEAYDEKLVEGKTALIDAVSTRLGYHGDFGRTVFVGEPRAAMMRKARLTAQAWDELRALLKPGMRFSEVSAKGQAILRRLGGDFPIPFGPHCVGLAHTENPSENLDGSLLDLVLQPGMIISVDCPLMESGACGTAHLEDLTLIREGGSEPIHDIGNQIIIA